MMVCVTVDNIVSGGIKLLYTITQFQWLFFHSDRAQAMKCWWIIPPHPPFLIQSVDPLLSVDWLISYCDGCCRLSSMELWAD